METNAGRTFALGRSAVRWFGWLALAGIVFNVTVAPLYHYVHHRLDRLPAIRVSGTKPISDRFRRAYNIDTPKSSPAYVVASGRADGDYWFIAAYQSPGGRVCYAQVRRGFGGGHGCSPRPDPATPVVFLGGSGDKTGVVDVGVAQPLVRTVVFLTDSGVTWTTPAVRPGKANFRVWATLEPRRLVGEPDEAWRDAAGRLHRLVDPTIVKPTLCANSESPLDGIPDGLPHAGSTTETRVQRLSDSSTDALVARYAATAVRVEPRDGQVWRSTPSGPKVVDASDYLLRLYLPKASSCPTGPQQFVGVPLSFAIGAAPPLPEIAKVYSAPAPEAPGDQSQPLGK